MFQERKSRSVDEIIRIGDTVALRACPAFRPGVIAFNPVRSVSSLYLKIQFCCVVQHVLFVAQGCSRAPA
jgi:hypothetical protein